MAGILFCTRVSSFGCHSRAGGNPVITDCFDLNDRGYWMPAFAGMTACKAMTSDYSDQSASPRWTLPGFNLGMRLALPVLPGMMAFGLAVGATAARKGLGFTDNLLMN